MHYQRRHGAEFKFQVCKDIRAGVISQRETQRRYSLSPTLVGVWLKRYDKGELEMEKTDPAIFIEYEAKIAALERKIGQLTMENELLKKTQRQRAARDNARSSIITGPKVAPSGGDAT
jgi:transposase-like protein